MDECGNTYKSDLVQWDVTTRAIGLVEPEISLDDFLMRLVYYLDEW